MGAFRVIIGQGIRSCVRSTKFDSAGIILGDEARGKVAFRQVNYLFLTKLFNAAALLLSTQLSSSEAKNQYSKR